MGGVKAGLNIIRQTSESQLINPTAAFPCECAGCHHKLLSHLSKKNTKKRLCGFNEAFVFRGYRRSLETHGICYWKHKPKKHIIQARLTAVCGFSKNSRLSDQVVCCCFLVLQSSKSFYLLQSESVCTDLSWPASLSGFSVEVSATLL